jgi:hypothetical protein
LKPREEAGPVLEQGKKYTLVVDAGWRDAHGQPLANVFCKSFAVAAPVTSGIAPNDWKIEPPAAGASAPLTVRFPRPLDHGLLQHVLQVVDAAGKPDDRFGYLAAQKPWWKDTADLASTPTRLAAVDSSRQEALIDWGYVVCDAALRAHASAKLEQAPYNVKTQPAAGLPYPNPS